MSSMCMSKNYIRNCWLNVKIMGNHISTTHCKFNPKGGVIKKLDKDTYVNTQTGEIGKFNHTTTRNEDLKGIKKSMSKLRDIVNTNITNPKNTLWITLTYKDNMTDEKKLYKDYEKFVKKLHYHYGDFEYIACAEPQERGAWHMHVIMIFEHKPFIPNAELSALWEHGFTKTTSIEDVDNVGAYLSAYLSDLEIENQTSDSTCKKIIKGARLCLYPRGMHFYRTSKGIKQPRKLKLTVDNFVRRFILPKKIQPYHVTYNKTKEYDNGNVITWTVYNLNKTPNTEELLLFNYGAMLINDNIF